MKPFLTKFFRSTIRAEGYIRDLRLNILFAPQIPQLQRSLNTNLINQILKQHLNSKTFNKSIINPIKSRRNRCTCTSHRRAQLEDGQPSPLFDNSSVRFRNAICILAFVNMSRHACECKMHFTVV